MSHTDPNKETVPQPVAAVLVADESSDDEVGFVKKGSVVSSVGELPPTPSGPGRTIRSMSNSGLGSIGSTPSFSVLPLGTPKNQTVSMERAYYYPIIPGPGPTGPIDMRRSSIQLGQPVDPSQRAAPLGRSPLAADLAVGGDAGASHTTPSPYQIKLVAGSSSLELSQLVSEFLNTPLVDCTAKRDLAGVISINLKETVASHDVYLLQCCGMCPNVGGDVNTAFMELLFLIRRLKLARAERVNVVIPYFPYARQDRKTELRAPLSASAVAQMIAKMGADRVVTLDLHSGQVQGAFPNVPMDNLQMKQEFAHWLKINLGLKNPERGKKCCVVSPDAGGVERARKLGDAVNIGNVVTIVKRRAKAGVVSTMQTVGDVQGLTCIIVDDMVDTGGTLCKACELLVELGAKSVVACITHGLLSDPACDNINKCTALERIVVSDSLPQGHNVKRIKKLTVLPIAPLLSQVIARHHNEQSVSTLFNAAHGNTPKSVHTPEPATAGAGFPSSPPGPKGTPSSVRVG